MKKFTVRVFVNGSAPMVVPGEDMGEGPYLVTRPHSGQGYHATPAKYVFVDGMALKRLPENSDADFEYQHVLTVDDF